MQLLALIEAIAAQVTPANIEQYIMLVENLIAVAEKIEAAAVAPTQNAAQNGSAK